MTQGRDRIETVVLCLTVSGGWRVVWEACQQMDQAQCPSPPCQPCGTQQRGTSKYMKHSPVETHHVFVSHWKQTPIFISYIRQLTLGGITVKHIIIWTIPCSLGSIITLWRSGFHTLACPRHQSHLQPRPCVLREPCWGLSWWV